MRGLGKAGAVLAKCHLLRECGMQREVWKAQGEEAEQPGGWQRRAERWGKAAGSSPAASPRFGSTEMGCTLPRHQEQVPGRQLTLWLRDLGGGRREGAGLVWGVRSCLWFWCC